MITKLKKKIQGIARFIRPITFDFCPISCGSCNKAIATVEDVQMMKKKKFVKNVMICFILQTKINGKKDGVLKQKL